MRTRARIKPRERTCRAEDAAVESKRSETKRGVNSAPYPSPPPCNLTELKFNSIKATNSARLAARIFYPTHVRRRIGWRAHVKGKDEEATANQLLPRRIPSHQFVNWTIENLAEQFLDSDAVAIDGTLRESRVFFEICSVRGFSSLVFFLLFFFKYSFIYFLKTRFFFPVLTVKKFS